MILIDPRAGSGELARLFPPSPPISVQTLPFGDFAFSGFGPGGVQISVGIERKSLGDMLSSVRNGRFSGHQLPGLLDEYDLAYLIVEGHYRPSRDGVIEVLQGRNGYQTLYLGRSAFMYRELDCFLMTMELHTKLRCHRSQYDWETIQHVVNLYHYFNAKEWEEHRAHLAVHQLQPASMIPGHKLTLEQRRRLLVKKFAYCLPHISDKRAEKVAAKFATAVEMVGASHKDWLIPGSVGDKIAREVREEMGYDS